jgi:hypothetical protein
MASFARLHERGLTPRPAVSCGGGGAVLPLRRGAAQPRSQRYFTGGDLRRNLRRVPRCPRQWDLWIHLFQGELFTMPAGAMGTCWLVHVDGLTFACGRGGTIFTHPAK